MLMLAAVIIYLKIAAKVIYATPPYKRKVGEKALNFLKSSLKKSLPKEIETRIVYTSTKFRSQFAIKDKTKFEHQHDLVHRAKCLECDNNYTGEIGRRLGEHVCYHSGKDHKSHILKHKNKKAHKNVSSEDFCILGNGFSKNRFKRKISEVLFIQQ